MMLDKMRASFAKSLLEMIFPRERQVAPRNKVDSGSRKPARWWRTTFGRERSGNVTYQLHEDCNKLSSVWKKVKHMGWVFPSNILLPQSQVPPLQSPWRCPSIRPCWKWDFEQDVPADNELLKENGRLWRAQGLVWKTSPLLQLDRRAPMIRTQQQIFVCESVFLSPSSSQIWNDGDSTTDITDSAAWSSTSISYVSTSGLDLLHAYCTCIPKIWNLPLLWDRDSIPMIPSILLITFLWISAKVNVLLIKLLQKIWQVLK